MYKGLDPERQLLILAERVTGLDEQVYQKRTTELKTASEGT